jgi:hypothetical protein
VTESANSRQKIVRSKKVLQKKSAPVKSLQARQGQASGPVLPDWAEFRRLEKIFQT